MRTIAERRMTDDAGNVVVLRDTPLPAPGAGVWWPLRIPGRLWFGAVVLTSPIRAVAMLLDMAVAGCFLAVVGTGAAWWTGRITDEQVAAVAATLGERMLNVLGKSGLM